MTKEERLAADGYAGIEPVLFYGPRNVNGMGSNFSLHSVRLPHPFTGVAALYATGEHRYQAMKATTFEEHEYVRLSSSSFEAKERGRIVELRDGWGDKYGDLCYYVMFETILDKIHRHSDVRRWLSSTERCPIYEDSPTDDIWGWRHSSDYRGRNLLGRCWMESRLLLY